MWQDKKDVHERWLAASLARPVPALSPETTCGHVYDMMAGDNTLFGLAIVARGQPLGLIDRVSMMSDFARQYWREIYARRSITDLMDREPLCLEAELPIEAIGNRLEARPHSVLNSGFLVVRDGAYIGIGSTVDLLKLVADRALERARSLEAAHEEIRILNDDLEQRIEDRTAELRAAQQELMRKERLSALGQLTATVAHEIRNPLSSIRNTVFAIRETTIAAAPHLERPVARIERSVARCERIIGDLLDFTRARPIQSSTVIADDWLGEVLDEQPMPAGVKLVRMLGAAQCAVRFDQERMRQVLANLVENAAHALADAQAGGRERVIAVTTRIGNGYELLVEDNGTGIAPDVLLKVFEPLFTTKSFGTGLGLPTVKQIVEQHASTIAIASEHGHGTRVSICLPLAAAQYAAA
jgi:signal transduction histidine kinase